MQFFRFPVKKERIKPWFHNMKGYREKDQLVDAHNDQKLVCCQGKQLVHYLSSKVLVHEVVYTRTDIGHVNKSASR